MTRTETDAFTPVGSPAGPFEHGVPTADDPHAPTATEPAAAPRQRDLDGDQDVQDTRPELRSTGATAVAGFLASAGAGWLCAGLFIGSFARVVAITGAGIGAGLIALSYKTRRPVAVQSLVVPATLLAGAVLLLPYTTQGKSLPSLIGDSVDVGGLEFAPVAFTPGWHFLLLLITSLTAAAGAALAVGVGRPRLATFVPLPLLFAVAFIEPRQGGLLSAGVGLGFVVASLGVGYGVQLAHDDATTRSFEIRRLLKAAVSIVLLAIALVLIAQAGFLFPRVNPSNVIPPRQPDLPPPVPDRPLFSVTTPMAVPFRVGVLDGYSDNGWETAPFDPSLLRPVPGSGTLPPATPPVPVAPPASNLSGTAFLPVTFTTAALRGPVLPAAAEPELVHSPHAPVLYDPRTQIIQLAHQPPVGLSYTETAAAPPSAKQLEAATPAPSSLAEFTRVPPAPSVVAALLARAPAGNAFDRLQFLRTALYKAVVAKGSGVPARVPPALVGSMLAGGSASPYQIVGAEALLTRWAGIPARIGYGYYKRSTSGAANSPLQNQQIYPSDGASWLEAYFGGLGWVPLIGQPLHAEASLGEHAPNPQTQPSRQLALTVYVPVRLPDNRQLYQLIRYWVGLVAPYLVLALLLWLLWPAAVKRLRSARRARWAARAGPLGRIIVAYAEFRDAASDLHVRTAGPSPLLFLNEIAPDEEHAELAWLTTRTLWGDLRRDVQVTDAVAAERLSRSVRTRLRRAQPPLSRFAGLTSRVSLREPFTRDIPALWPAPRPDRAPGPAARSRRPRRLRPRIGPALAKGAALASVLVVLGGCVASTPTRGGPAALPSPIAPETLTVDSLSLAIQREPVAEAAFAKAGRASLVALGRVYTVRLAGAVQASLQVGAFKRGVDAQSARVRHGILASLGSGHFSQGVVQYAGRGWTVYRGALPEQTLTVYFPRSGAYYDLLIAQRSFTSGDAVLGAVLDYQETGHVST